MRINCRWRDKIGRYGAKLLKSLPADLQTIENPYTLTSLLKTIKHWRTSEERSGNLICDKLLSSPSLSPSSSTEILKYGLRTGQSKYLDYGLQHWDRIGFTLSERELKEITPMLDSLETPAASEASLKAKNPHWKNESLLAYLNHPHIVNAEISADSQRILVELKHKQIAFYGLTYAEDSISHVLEIIDKLKITHICLPLQAATPNVPSSQLPELLANKLTDNTHYKALEVHKLVISNIFGVKTTNFPWSLVLRSTDTEIKPKSHPNFTFYYPNTHRIMQHCSDFTKVEKLVRTCVLLDYCRIFEEIREQGCYLCNKHRIHPIPFQDQAIFAAPFVDSMISDMGNAVNNAVAASQGNVLVLGPQRLLLEIVEKTLYPKAVEVNKGVKLGGEANMMLNLLYNTET